MSPLSPLKYSIMLEHPVCRFTLLVPCRGHSLLCREAEETKVRKIESDGSCLLVVGGRGGGGGVDGLICGSDYLLITIRRELLEEEENV